MCVCVCWVAAKFEGLGESAEGRAAMGLVEAFETGDFEKVAGFSLSLSLSLSLVLLSVCLYVRVCACFFACACAWFVGVLWLRVWAGVREWCEAPR